ATAFANVAPANTNGTFTGHLTVTAGGQTAQFTVTFQVGTGVGGGGGGTFNVGQTSVALASPSGQQSAFINITSNNTAITTFNFIVNSAPWLLVNGSSSGNGVPLTSGINITLNATAVSQLPAS